VTKEKLERGHVCLATKQPTDLTATIRVIAWFQPRPLAPMDPLVLANAVAPTRMLPALTARTATLGTSWTPQIHAKSARSTITASTVSPSSLLFHLWSDWIVSLATEYACPTNYNMGMSYCSAPAPNTTTTTTPNVMTTTPTPTETAATPPPVTGLDTASTINIIIGCVFAAAVIGLMLAGFAFYYYGVKNKLHTKLEASFDREELEM